MIKERVTKGQAHTVSLVLFISIGLKNYRVYASSLSYYFSGVVCPCALQGSAIILRIFFPEIMMQILKKEMNFYGSGFARLNA